MATFNVKNSGDLQAALKHIQDKANASLKAVARKVEEEVKKYIQENLYDVNSHDYYDRTMEFLNSVDIRPTGTNSVEIYFDTSKINPYAGAEGMWSQHQNITNGNDVSNMIPEFMEKGVSGSLHDREGIYSMENTAKDLEKSKLHIDELIKQLALKGIKATRV